MYKIVSVVIFTCLGFAAAQSTRCFQFTWLGPRYNNESVFLNATCQEATRLASGVPCQQPLVASYAWTKAFYLLRSPSKFDASEVRTFLRLPMKQRRLRSKAIKWMRLLSDDGSWPDVEYIWTHYGQQASCVLADNDVCAQFTYYFNGHPENSTYMCTRATDSNGTTVRNGCYQEVSGSYSTKVCFCRGVAGGVPCNNAHSTKTTFALAAFSLWILQIMMYGICK